MRVKKSLGVALLSIVIASAMPMTTFATGIREQSTLYTKTVNSTVEKKTVTSIQNLGLALSPGKNGYSSVISFRFTSLPANAKVKSITIEPGTGIMNNNNRNMLGIVKFSYLNIVSPNGIAKKIIWNPRGMREDPVFFNYEARGTWTVQAYGSNITRPTGNYLIDLRSMGSLAYKNMKMTISYTVD